MTPESPWNMIFKNMNISDSVVKSWGLIWGLEPRGVLDTKEWGLSDPVSEAHLQHSRELRQ